MSDVHRRFLLDGVHHSRKKSARKRENEENARKRENEENVRKRETSAKAQQSGAVPAAPDHRSLTEGNVGKRMIWPNTNI